MILHHTDCGIIRLADYPEQLAAFFEMPADELESDRPGGWRTRHRGGRQ